MPITPLRASIEDKAGVLTPLPTAANDTAPAEPIFVAKCIDPATFPHPPRAGAKTLSATMENLEHLVDQSGFSPRYNVISKKLEVRRTDGTAASMSEIISLAMLHGMGTGHIYPFISEIGAKRPFNPVRDWILSAPWDGDDHVSMLCATITEQADYPVGLKDVLLRKWLLSAVAAALSEKGFKTRGVLTFQGEQGLGKTSWVAALMPRGDLRDQYIKVDHHLDGSNKDSILGAVSHWIVEIGEVDSSFKKDIARLKGFITSDCDKLRRPYGREEVEYRRRTIFAATVNEEHFLVDSTGNSRWWTIAADRLEFNHNIDMQQVFAQLAVRFNAGDVWWLTRDEEKSLTAYNAKHRSVSVIAERVLDHIDHEKIGAAGGEMKTPSQLLKDIGILNPTNAQAKECGGVLRELLGAPSRIQGINKWRIHAKADQVYTAVPRPAPKEF